MPRLKISDFEPFVTAGAALLDKERPGWWQRTNLGKLRIASCLNCVLGQEFTEQANAGGKKDNPFCIGIERLGLGYAESSSYGFIPPLPGKTGLGWEKSFPLLQAAWVREIKNRRRSH